MQDTDEYDELDDAGDSHATLGSVILDCLEDKEFEGKNHKLLFM